MDGCISRRKKRSTPDTTIPLAAATASLEADKRQNVKVQEIIQTPSNEMQTQQPPARQKQQKPDQQQRKQQIILTSSSTQQSGNGGDNKIIVTKQQPKLFKEATKICEKKISKSITSNEQILFNQKVPPQMSPKTESSIVAFGKIKKKEEPQQNELNSFRVFDQPIIIENNANDKDDNDRIPNSSTPVIKINHPTPKLKPYKKIKRKGYHRTNVSTISIQDIFDVTIEGTKNDIIESEEKERNNRESKRTTSAENDEEPDCVKVIRFSPSKQWSSFSQSPLPIISPEPFQVDIEEQSDAALLLSEQEGIDLDIEKVFSKRRGNRPEDHTLYEISNEIPELSFNLIPSIENDNNDN